MDRLDDLYQQAADDPASSQLVTTYPSQVRPQILTSLVSQELVRGIARENHLTVSAGDIARERDAVEQERETLPGEDLLLPVDLLAEVRAYRAAVQMWALSDGESGAQQRLTDAFLQSIKNNPVTLNPRFGKFDADKATVRTDADVAVTPAPSASTEP